ncbi:MAG: DEDD exonuclease domain-containing protein [Actinomycetota bacterium]|nr:DEDD exonuclease domain-containing protein [Actinomycetota bacterium]
MRQRSFDDLGTALSCVTFCVLDLETTGGSPTDCLITEVGAVKVRGGEVLGTFGTLVNPGCAIPPQITLITGITDRLVAPAPSIDRVLPSFLEFIGGSVIVGHNLRFDLAFLHHALRRWGGPMLGNQHLDTLALARRLLAGEMPNFRLGELARRLRLPHQPNHRALDDAWATTDLLHYLIERATAWGVTGLDDLVNLPSIAGHPQAKKLGLTKGLPRKPGIYQFRSGEGTVLYVGKATDLRSRVRSYFSSDQRKKVAQLLRETHDITWEVCDSVLAAELLELRLIQEHQPRYNHRGRHPATPQFVRLSTDERLPRLTIGRAPGPLSIGPLTTRRQAELVVEAIQTALPIRRCATRVGPRAVLPVVPTPCTSGQLGTGACPCSGATTEAEYLRIASATAQAMTSDPQLVLEPLAERMRVLAASERFEEAAAVRDRAGAFAAAVAQQRRLQMVRDAGRFQVETTTGHRITIDGGRPQSGGVTRITGSTEAGASDQARSLDEALCVVRWLDRNAQAIRVIDVEGRLCSPLPALPDFQPRPA